MKRARKLISGVAVGVLVGGLLVGARPATAEAARDVAVPAGGRASARPTLIDPRTSPAAPAAAPAEHATLGVDGRPTGAGLASSGTVAGLKPAAGAARARLGPNAADRAGAAQPLAPSPTTVNANFNGINQAGGGGAQPSDVNASVGATQIL